MSAHNDPNCPYCKREAERSREHDRQLDRAVRMLCNDPNCAYCHSLLGQFTERLTQIFILTPDELAEAARVAAENGPQPLTDPRPEPEHPDPSASWEKWSQRAAEIIADHTLGRT